MKKRKKRDVDQAEAREEQHEEKERWRKRLMTSGTHSGDKESAQRRKPQGIRTSIMFILTKELYFIEAEHTSFLYL